jgi:hypothetical protein
MADQHQVSAIMATAICDCRKDNPDPRIDPEEAKHVAKCIVAALASNSDKRLRANLRLIRSKLAFPILLKLL